MTELTYAVPGVSCEHCRHAISTEVGRVPGVDAVDGRPRAQGGRRPRRRVGRRRDSRGDRRGGVRRGGPGGVTLGAPAQARPLLRRAGARRRGRCARRRREPGRGHAERRSRRRDAHAAVGARTDKRACVERRRLLARHRPHGAPARALRRAPPPHPRPLGQPGDELRSRRRRPPAPDRRPPRPDRYQHLHPHVARDGSWSVPVTLAAPGAYRAYADFEVDGAKTVLGTDLFAAGTFIPSAASPPSLHARADGYDVELVHGALRAGEESELSFRVRRGGQPVTRFDEYVGRRGHLVALHEGDLAYTHVHPVRRCAGRRDPLRRRARRRRGVPPLPAVQDGRRRTHRPVRSAGGAMSVVERLDLPIEGMTCASCAARIERRLNKLDGVSASVNYATEKAVVEYDPAQADAAGLVAVVEEAGYSARLPTAEPAPAEEARRRRPAPPARARVRALAAGARDGDDPGAPVPLLAVARAPARDARRLWAGWPFHRAAWQNLRHATATMDTLVSLGTLSAWGWSVVALFFLDAGVAGMRMPFELTPSRNGAGAPDLPRGRVRRDRVPARRPVLRGACEAQRRRGTARARRARREGRLAPRRGRQRATGAHRRSARR